MKVTVKQTTQKVVSTVGIQGPSGVTELNSASDVDTTQDLQDKSLLMYDANSGKWKPSKKLEDHYMNAGHF